MDFFSLGALVTAVGYWIFKSSEEEEFIQRRWIVEQKRLEQLETENQRQKESAAKERIRPFHNAHDCFINQYVSYSRLSTYCKCPQRFKLNYLDRRTSEYSPYYRRGSQFHNAIEEYLIEFVGKVAPPMHPSTLMSRISSKSSNTRAAVQYFCKTFPWDSQILAVEHELTYKINSINFFGIIDCVVRHPDGLVEIIDFKTGTSILPVREQLELYCLPLTLDDTVSKIRLRYMLLDRKYTHCWYVTDEYAQDISNRLLHLTNTIINDSNFHPVIKSHCNNCGVEKFCPYGRKAYTSNEYNQYRESKHKLTRIRISRKRDTKGIYIEDEHQSENNNKYEPAHNSAPTFDYSKASRRYLCEQCNQIIPVGKMYFATRRGNRICEKDFRNLYADEYSEFLTLLEEKKRINISTSWRLVRSRSTFKCTRCGSNIFIGQPHFSNKSGKHVHRDCSKSKEKQNIKSQKKERSHQKERDKTTLDNQDSNAKTESDKQQYCCICTSYDSIETCHKCGNWVCPDCSWYDTSYSFILCTSCRHPSWKRERLTYRQQEILLEAVNRIKPKETISIYSLLTYPLETHELPKIERILKRFIRPGEDMYELTKKQFADLVCRLPGGMTRRSCKKWLDIFIN